MLQLWQMVSASLSFHHPLLYHTVTQTAPLTLSPYPSLGEFQRLAVMWLRKRDRKRATLDLKMLTSHKPFSTVQVSTCWKSSSGVWRIYICNRFKFANITLKHVHFSVHIHPAWCCSSVFHHASRRNILLLSGCFLIALRIYSCCVPRNSDFTYFPTQTLLHHVSGASGLHLRAPHCKEYLPVLWSRTPYPIIPCVLWLLTGFSHALFPVCPFIFVF